MLLTILLGVALQTRDPSQAMRVRDSIAREIGRRASERARRESHSAVRRPVTPEHLATAFKTDEAKVLLERARIARMSQDSALLSYDVNAYQRISAGIGFSRLGRDRLVFRTEQAGRVRWQRDAGMWVDVTGARTVLPGIPDIGEREARKGIARASDAMLPVPYFPGYEPLWTGPEAARPEIDENGPVHPLAEGSEAYYTYSAGDSIMVTLPDHRVIRLRSLDIRPREAKWNLMVGSLWFEESGQLVRAAYRFAVPMHIDAFVLEEDPTAFDDVPAWVKPLMMPMHGEVSAVTIEYGMYEGRFWLPRVRAAEGTGTASFMRVPFKVEQTFKYNSVNGLDSLPRVSVTRAPRTRRSMSQCDTSEYRVTTTRRYGDARIPVAMRMPCDPDVLMTSPDLPASIYDSGDQLFDIKARESLISEALAMGAQPPFTLNPHNLPRPEWTPLLRQMRYNRIEGLSAGAEITQTLGGGCSFLGAGRIGIADRDPNAEVTLTRSNLSASVYASAYKRLTVAGDWGNPLSFGSSISAVLFGRDEGFYYRANGVELGGRTERGTPIDWRFFAERERTAVPATSFSVGGNNATPNIVAWTGTYVGTSMRVRHTHGLDPNGFRIFTDLRIEGAMGDSVYGRGALDLTLTEGFGQYAGALTLSGGSSVGALPPQRRWYLGGTHTVRGQSPDTAQAGDAYWRVRAEIGRTIQGARPVVFTDLGWAGDRNRPMEIGRPLSGAGVGASLLDGLIRFDVARGIYPRRQWRVDLSVEAVF